MRTSESIYRQNHSEAGNRARKKYYNKIHITRREENLEMNKDECRCIVCKMIFKSSDMILGDHLHLANRYQIICQDCR